MSLSYLISAAEAALRRYVPISVKFQSRVKFLKKRAKELGTTIANAEQELEKITSRTCEAGATLKNRLRKNGKFQMKAQSAF